MKAIETRYNGYRFRSRLEARWAVFFDAMGLGYEYEMEGYDLGDGLYYLPDFYLPKAKSYVEVKYGDFQEDDKRKWIALAKSLPGGAVFVCRGSPWGVRHHLRYHVIMVWGDTVFFYAVWGECAVCGSLGVLVFLKPQLRGAGVDFGDNPMDCFFCLNGDCTIGGGCGYEFNPTASPVDTPRLYAAFEAASYARFEHGETPRKI